MRNGPILVVGGSPIAVATNLFGGVRLIADQHLPLEEALKRDVCDLKNVSDKVRRPEGETAAFPGKDVCVMGVIYCPAFA